MTLGFSIRIGDWGLFLSVLTVGSFRCIRGGSENGMLCSSLCRC